MRGYEAIRDGLRSRELSFRHLDAAQLIKHALGLLTQSTRQERRARLYYLHAEPTAWASGKTIEDTVWSRHRDEVAEFVRLVAGNTVEFAHGTWRQFLDELSGSPHEGVREHARLVSLAFAPL